MTWQHWAWFNLSAPWLRFGRRGGPLARPGIRLWNLFNRVTNTGDHFWGIGLLQINSRHLLFVGDDGVRVVFLGRSWGGW